MSDTAGPDRVKQTDKVLLSSLNQKYKLAKGYKHRVTLLTSGDTTYYLGRDFKLETTESGDTYIAWTFFDDPNNGIGGGSYWFPAGMPDGSGPYDFQNKTTFPNGDLDDDFFWFFESYNDTVNFVNEGLQAKYVTVGAGGGPVYTRTEYSNNIRFSPNVAAISTANFPPAIMKTRVRPAYRTGAIPDTQLGLGLYTGEGMILYGTPCDFVGIGGYDSGCVDSCPSPAGTGGTLGQSNSFEGSARIYRSTQVSDGNPTLKVFRAQSTLDGIDVTATGIANVGGNVRITTAGAHGYNVGDIVYMTGGTGTFATGNGILPYTVIYLDEEGFRVTAVPDATHFEIDAPDPASWTWNFGAPWPTIQKVSSCSVNYWDSGVVFSESDIQLAVKQSKDTEAGEDAKYTFFYNMTGLEKDWKRVGPLFSKPLGHDQKKVILGSYMGGFFNLAGSVGTFNSTMSADGTNYPTTWRKLESESVYYTKGPDWPADIPDYTPIPIFDEEGM